jgi:hypothetical protein
MTTEVDPIIRKELSGMYDLGLKHAVLMAEIVLANYPSLLAEFKKYIERISKTQSNDI